MSNVDTDKIKEGKEEFENNNTRPGWDKQNYVAVLERYKFPTHCIEAGKLLGAADPKALYAHIQANPDGFDEDHVQEFLEVDLNTKTFDVIDQLSFNFINGDSTCKCLLPTVTSEQTYGGATAAQGIVLERLGSTLSEAMDYEYQAQAIEAGFSEGLAEVAESLEVSAGALLDCAVEYKKKAERLQQYIDIFWEDCKTKMFADDTVDYRIALGALLPIPGNSNAIPGYHNTSTIEASQLGNKSGQLLSQVYGSTPPAGLSYPYTTLSMTDSAYETVSLGGTREYAEGKGAVTQTRFANVDKFLDKFTGANETALLYAQSFKGVVETDTEVFLEVKGSQGGTDGMQISSIEELKAFPYMWASLLIRLVGAYQELVNAAATEDEINRLKQNELGGEAYNQVTYRNHGGAAAFSSPRGRQVVVSVDYKYNFNDGNLLPANSLQLVGHRTVESFDKFGTTADERLRLKDSAEAAINQLNLVIKADRTNASGYENLRDTVQAMINLVHGEEGSTDNMLSDVKCIKKQDNENATIIDNANDALEDALGSDGMPLTGFFKDRARNAMIRRAKATMDQRSGNDEIFGANVAEKVLFKEQCFLLSFINTISNFKKTNLDYVKNGIPVANALTKRLPYDNPLFPQKINSDGTRPGLYNACLQVQGDAYGFINKLTQNRISTALHDIENWHLSSIQPKIRLFKVIYDEEGNEKEIELKFNSHFAAEELDYFKNARSRGAGVGLKSFTFTYDGSNPFSAKKSIKANMKIFASTFKELFVKRKGDTTQASSETGGLEIGEPNDYRYIDLALKTWTNKRDPNDYDRYDLMLNENADKIKLNFRLKAVVGLSAPEGKKLPNGRGSGIWGADYSNEVLSKALSASFVTLNLTPTVHSFDFDDQGRVIFDINYLAYVEDFFDEKAYNIFADPEGELGIKRTLRELKVKKYAKNCEGSEELTLLKKEHADVARREKRIALKRLLNTLSNDEKIYYINVPLSKARTFVSNGPFANYEDYVDFTSDSFIKNEADQASQSAKDVIAALDNFNFSDEEIDNPKLDQLKASLVGVNPEKNYISFFYVSDLIDTVLANIEKELVYLIEALPSRIQNQDINTDDYSRKLADLKKYHRNLSKFRVLLGPVEFAEPVFTEVVNEQGVPEKKARYKIDFVNFGDIPISTRYFAEFLADRVFTKDEPHYSITRFLNDLFNNLIDNFLNGQRCFDFDISQKIRVNQNVLTSYSSNSDNTPANVIDDITYLLKEKNKNMLNRNGSGNPTRLFLPIGFEGGDQQARDAIANGSILNISGNGDGLNYAPLSHEINYFVFFAGRTRPADRMNGDKEEDASGGIFHYLLGRNKGIVKSIKLQKTQTPGLQEVRFEQEGYDGLEQLRVVYDVEIETYANVKTFPGTYIYIPPEGFDPSSNYGLELPPGFKMTDYGIGGYYMIYRSEHNFGMGEATTKIYAKWVAQVESEAKEQASGRVTGTNTRAKCRLPRRDKAAEQ